MSESETIKNTETYTSKVVSYSICIFLIALGLFYGGKHVAHIKCVEAALEMRCKNVAGYQEVESVDVPWWNPFNSDGYDCSAKIAFSGGVKDVGFTAKKVRAMDLIMDVVELSDTRLRRKHHVAEDWDVNLGCWGWIGDDYIIMNIKTR